MLHVAVVGQAKPRVARRDTADIVDVIIAKVICVEVSRRVELVVMFLSLL